MPRVSILLPNLNQRPFLPERLDSIFNQTLTDWELVVIDGFSTDGSWDYLQERCAGDNRIRLKQSPAQGIYQAWNECWGLAAAELIYFATSDDSMLPDCLEKLAAALERHPECGLAHCCLSVVDENSRAISGSGSWNEQPFARYYLGREIAHEHTRPAPHDGLLHCAIGTVFTSITQLLLRRRVFQEAGGFREDCGPRADFEWGARVTFLYDSVYLPEFLATWRRHGNQATDDQANATAAIRLKMAAMAETALQSAALIQPGLLNLFPSGRWTQFFRHQAIILQRIPVSPWLRIPLMLLQWVLHPGLVRLDYSSLARWKGRYRLAHRARLFQEMRRLGIRPLFTLDQ